MSQDNKYIIRISRTKSGKNIIKICLANNVNRPVNLEASVILRRKLKMMKKRRKHKHKTFLKLDKNNAIEMQIINNRRRKLLSVMRALG